MTRTTLLPALLVLSTLHFAASVSSGQSERRQNPRLVITSPRTEEDWEIGTPEKVGWDLVGQDADKVEIELSRDGGLTWEILLDSSAGDLREWIWSEVTPPMSCECKIRVTVSNRHGTYDEQSVKSFHIVPEDQAHRADRTFSFAGLLWGVRPGSGSTTEDPGNNYWSDSYENVWVETYDDLEELHLKLTRRDDKWYCCEVFTLDPTAYGIHRFYTIGRVDLLDPMVVVGFFLYKNDCSEVDIEFSTWGRGAGYNNLQYAVQPADAGGNVSSSLIELNGAHTTHCIDWQPKKILFTSIHGHYPKPLNTCYCIPNPSPGFCLANTSSCGWEYRGVDIPSIEKDLRVHLNIWLLDGEGDNAPLDGEEVEIAIRAIDLPNTHKR